MNRAGRRIAAAAACRARRRLRRTMATTRAPARRSRTGRADFGADPAPPRYRRYQLRATPPPRLTPRDRRSEPWNTPNQPTLREDRLPHRFERFKNETEIKAVHAQAGAPISCAPCEPTHNQTFGRCVTFFRVISRLGEP